MHFVYLLKSKDFPEKTYVGYTTDVEQRLKFHNSGKSPYTNKYKPWEMHCYFAFINKQCALQFELYLKSHSGHAFAKKRLW